MVPEVPVRQPVHQAPPARVQACRGPGLGDAVAVVATEVGVVRGSRERNRTGERRAPRVGPVDVPPVQVEAAPHVGPAEAHEVLGRAGGRRRPPVEVGRQHGPGAGIRSVQIDEGGGLAGEHGPAVEGHDTHATPAPVLVELVDRHEVAVRPHADLRVVVLLDLADDERVAVPRAGRVTGPRDSDALVEGTDRRVVGPSELEGELADQEPIAYPIVGDDWISLAPVLADAPEALPQRLHGRLAEQHASLLAEDLERVVDHLDVVLRPDGAVGVGRDVAVHVVQASEHGT